MLRQFESDEPWIAAMQCYLLSYLYQQPWNEEVELLGNSKGCDSKVYHEDGLLIKQFRHVSQARRVPGASGIIVHNHDKADKAKCRGSIPALRDSGRHFLVGVAL